MDSNCAESNVGDFFCCPGVWGLRDHRYNLLFISVIICSFIGLVGGGREKPAANGGAGCFSELSLRARGLRTWVAEDAVARRRSRWPGSAQWYRAGPPAE